MARDCIKSRASFRSKVWTEKREFSEKTGVRSSWPRLLVADLESLDLKFEGESSALATRGVRFVFGLAESSSPPDLW